MQQISSPNARITTCKPLVMFWHLARKMTLYWCSLNTLIFQYWHLTGICKNIVSLQHFHETFNIRFFFILSHSFEKYDNNFFVFSPFYNMTKSGGGEILSKIGKKREICLFLFSLDEMFFLGKEIQKYLTIKMSKLLMML